jgi:hypothetical protein
MIGQEAIEMVEGLIEDFRKKAHENEVLALKSGKCQIHFYYDGRSHAYTMAADMLEIAFNL